MSKFDTKSKRCVKCGKTYNLHRHHVTYHPPIIRLLCAGCHRKITEINTVAAKLFGTNKKTRVKFTNVVRLMLWQAYIEGVMR